MRIFLIAAFIFVFPLASYAIEEASPEGVPVIKCEFGDDCAEQKGEESQELVMCTMDVRVCLDGSHVARTGPNCEFPLCPSER